MKRLTEWVCDNQWYSPKKGVSPNQIHSKLGKYEDTGLEPEEVVEYKKFEDNLVQIYNCDLNHILELLKKEQQGRLVELPEQDLSQINDYLEPLKVYAALKSELMKLDIRQKSKPESISELDYTIIYALQKILRANKTEGAEAP